MPEGFRIVSHGLCCQDDTVKWRGQEVALTWNNSEKSQLVYPRGLCQRWVQTRGNQERKMKIIAVVWGCGWKEAEISSGMCLWGWAEKVSREGKRKPSCPELGWLFGGWGERWARLKTREKNLNLIWLKVIGLGLPWWLGGKESSCQCRRHGFNSWSMKISHATEPLSPCPTTIGPVP